MLALTLGTYVRPGALGPAGYQTPRATTSPSPAYTDYVGAGPKVTTSFTTNPGPPRGTLSPGSVGPLTPPTPTAPGPGPVIITTTPIPGIPLDPPQQVPGAGPVLTTSPSPGGGGSAPWYDLFNPQGFTWWKPVLLAGGIALFGGAILAFLKKKSHH